jgi:hypothetical protein
MARAGRVVRLLSSVGGNQTSATVAEPEARTASVASPFPPASPTAITMPEARTASVASPFPPSSPATITMPEAGAASVAQPLPQSLPRPTHRAILPHACLHRRILVCCRRLGSSCQSHCKGHEAHYQSQSKDSHRFLTSSSQESPTGLMPPRHQW